MKTHKYLLISLIVFSCASVSIAQQQAPGTSASNPQPTNPKEYVSPDGRFKVLFPGTPNEVHETVETAMGKLPFHMLIYPATPTISYHLVYMEYPIDLESAGLVKSILDNARQGSLSRVPKEEDPRVTEERDISIDGHPGKFLRIELKSDNMMRMRFAVVENRVYVVGVGTPKSKPKISDATNDYEAIGNRFLDSFSLMRNK